VRVDRAMTFKAVDLLGMSAVVDYEGMFKEAGVEVELVGNFCPLEATEEQIIAAVGDGDAAITQATYQPFPREVFSSLSNLKFVVSVGVGYDKMDVDAATELGILTANVPDFCLEEVSDHAMALILACTRRIVQLDHIVKTIGWKEQPDRYIGSEVWPKMTKLRGLTLGLIAFGRIPRTLVPKAKGFGMRIIACDPYLEPDVFREFGVERVELDQLLTESDVVSIHAPFNSETKHAVGLEQLKKMKPTACLVNTARGPIVDHKALYTALTEGFIAAAGSDATEPEPINPDNPLLKLDNFIVTAHSAHANSTANPGLSQRPAEEIIRVVRGEWPVGLIDQRVKEKYLHKWARA
jgi:D-3-phosphoglycerate dehydrogenase / 2-oxoglutarate reductase